MKKIKIFPMLFVMLLLTAVTYASGVSFSGQPGDDPYAIKFSIQQANACWFHGNLPSNTAWFGGYEYKGKTVTQLEFKLAFMSQMHVLQPAMTQMIVDRLNAENSASNPIYVNQLGQPLMITPTVAEQKLARWLVKGDAQKGRHIYMSFNSALDGSTVQTERENYPNEQWFYFVKPGCKDLAFGSDLCLNLFPNVELMEEYARPKSEFAQNSKYGKPESEYVAPQPKPAPQQRRVNVVDPNGSVISSQAVPASGDININMAPVTVYGAKAYGAKVENSGNSVTGTGSTASTRQVPQTPQGDWTPGQLVTTTSVPPGGDYNRTAQGGCYSGDYSSNQYAESDNRYLKRTANATTATAVGTFLGVIVNAVTGGMTVNRLGRQNNSGYYYNGYNNNGSTYTNNTGNGPISGPGVSGGYYNQTTTNGWAQSGYGVH